MEGLTYGCYVSVCVCLDALVLLFVFILNNLESNPNAEYERVSASEHQSTQVKDIENTTTRDVVTPSDSGDGVCSKLKVLLMKRLWVRDLFQRNHPVQLMF